MSRGPARTILLLSQTVSLPARRRTWQQARALARAGWRVRVLCPLGAAQPRRETIDGIEIVRFAQPFEGNGKSGILLEYALALVTLTTHLIRARLRERIDVVQVANPPDWVVIPALLMRLAGARMVFDLADLSTVLFEAKFGRSRLWSALLGGLTAVALRAADLVVAANDTYRRFAVAKRRRAPGRTIAIHSYPERLSSVRERDPGPLRIGYFGILGSHDGVDRLIEAAARLEGDSFELVIVGDGPALPSLRRLAARAGPPNVRFTGFLAGAAREAAIASFDVAVIADPVNRYTRSISPNKLFAYAAHGLAVVSTPLAGTRRLLPGALFTRDDSAAAIADGLDRVLRDEALRRRLGAAARERAEAAFDWSAEAARYVAAVGALAPVTMASATAVAA